VPPTSVLLAPDSRTAEEWLLAEVERRARGSTRLSEPLRVVVPSQSLRQHLQARFAERRSAWLGLEVATLHAAARSILSAAGMAPRDGTALLPILLERRARGRRILSAAFGDFRDGWSALAASASDLADAGFEPILAEALVERVETERDVLPARTLQRARALIEALAEALTDLEALGLTTSAGRLAAAAGLLAERGPSVFPARALFLHGFADATGAATELLIALTNQLDATVLLLEPDGSRSAERFGSRLRERFEGVGGAARELPASVGPLRLRIHVAPDPMREARALARAARAAIDAGERPEEIGIVYRDPGPVRSDLRRELERRGVPFSASSARGPVAARAHRARAILRLLEERGGLPTDVALELLAPVPPLSGEHRAAVRLALRALGAARLREAAAIDTAALAQSAPGEGYPLPVRSRLAEDDEGATFAPRRRLPWPVLRAAVERVKRLLKAAEGWPAHASWHRHLAALRLLLAATGAERDELLDEVESFGAEVPAGFEVEASEALGLLRDRWSRDERLRWGGRGAGVQILSVTEARGRTFGLLLAGGLARGHFPRIVTEDPLLPDGLRLRLRELLPDLPVKREGHDEERFLFAQLIGAAPEGVLSRAANDVDGRPLPPSPLLDSLEREAALAVWEDDDRAPEPALDRAVAAALAAPDHRSAAVALHLAAALDEGCRRFAGVPLADLAATARARSLVLAELDADPATEEGRRRIRALGPYFGFVGRLAREGGVAATTLEAHARCGWQSFLERTLKLEVTPDPLDTLPGLTPLLVGTAVHEALARLFAYPKGAFADPQTVEARRDAPGRELAWPSDEVVARVVAAVSRRQLTEAGLAGRGLEALLERRVRERLEVARELDRAQGAAAVLGTELEGVVQIGGATVTFRADRLQREGGRLVALDFKTGKLSKSLPTNDKREAARQALVASGARLQGALYAAALAPGAAEGRYRFLAPVADDGERELAFAADDSTLASLSSAVGTIASARAAGLYPPRLLDSGLEKEFAGCKWCAVAEACLQRDSGFRLRLERWHEHETKREGARSEAEEALWRLWRLPAADGEESE